MDSHAAVLDGTTRVYDYFLKGAGSGRLTLKMCLKSEVGPENVFEVGGWP